MAIDAGFIEELKERNDIYDVISAYVSLKKAGSNYKGLCPFHLEKTPSFTVFPSTKTFYCFGCSVGGDVISFTMKNENLDYINAVEVLAKRAGMRMPDDSGDSNISRKRRRLVEMNVDAAKFFNSILFSKEGERGYAYLRGSRGLSDAVIKHFGLGYAPNDYHRLSEYMLGKGYAAEELKDAFLCGIDKNGKSFDYFRDRVIFPIINLSGEVVAFSGRVIEGKANKYLNTSDTLLFKKSRTLFGMNFAKNFCDEQLILCEGNIDVVTCHDNGFTNTVATLGKSITPEQARIIRNYTKSVAIAYDSDGPGTEGARAALKVLDEAGIKASVISYSGAKDPDEYIKKYGRKSFADLLERGQSKFEFFLSGLLAGKNLDDTEVRIDCANKIVAEIAGYSSGVKRELYSRRAAELLSISYDTIKSDVEKYYVRIRNRREKDERVKSARKLEGYADTVKKDAPASTGSSKSEEGIIGIIVSHPDLISFCRKNLSPDDFITPFARSVYEKILEISKGAILETGMLNEFFDTGQMSRIIQMGVSREGLRSDEVVLGEMIELLKNEKIRKENDLNKLIELKRKGMK